MYTFQNIIIFFGYFFIYILSTKVTKIESTSELILGEKVTFILTVQEYDYNDAICLGDEIYICHIILEDCVQINDNILTCDAYLYLDLDLGGLTKTLYVKRISTNLTVTINKPKILKLLDFYNYSDYYSYGVSEFNFDVNFNELYNSGVSIKFGDISLTKCEKRNYYEINCKYEIPESYNEKTLILSFNGVETDYYIKIKAPPIFTKIEKLNKNIYYSRPSSQFVYFEVDSSYNMNNHKIELVPFTSGNKNITLNECTYDYSFYYAKCLGILDTNDAYYVYVNGINIKEKLFVYPEPTAISKVYHIDPYEMYILKSETTFALEVNHVVNIEKAVFTLIDEYDSKNKIYLTNCSSGNKYSYLNEFEITCVGKLTNPGYYYVYLNGLKQDVHTVVYCLSLSKALYIEPNQIIFDSATQPVNININFDDDYDEDYDEPISFMLKGENNKKEINLEINSIYMLSASINVTFPAEDTYYLYLDNVKQNVSIEVRKKNFTSQIFSISPNIITSDKDKDIIFTLKVDSNFGIYNVDLEPINIEERPIYDKGEWNMHCKPDSSDEI